MFVAAMTFFSCNELKYVSMNNQECKVGPGIMNINSNEPSNINDPYADVTRDMKTKVFHLMSRINETRHASWYENLHM